VEFDVIGVCVGAALVSGALSLVGPHLAALTAALAALALAGWAAQVRRAPGRLRRSLAWRSGGAVASIVAGAGLFVAGPSLLLPFRGLLLALLLIPLWSVARRLPPGDR
jgi:hypothetical protein